MRCAPPHSGPVTVMVCRGRPPVPLFVLPAATRTFDLRGYPHELLMPIMVMACARAQAGAVIAMTVDDLGFVEALRRWEPSAAATLLGVECRGTATEVWLQVDQVRPGGYAG